MAVEIIEDRLRAQVARHGWMRNDAGRGGSEDQSAGGIGVTHRPRAEPVDRQQAAHAVRVDHRDGERAGHLLQAFGAVPAIALGESGSVARLAGQSIEVRRAPADSSFYRSQQRIALMQAHRANPGLDRQGATGHCPRLWRFGVAVLQCVAHAVQRRIDVPRWDADPATDAAHAALQRRGCAVVVEIRAAADECSLTSTPRSKDPVAT